MTTAAKKLTAELPSDALVVEYTGALARVQRQQQRQQQEEGGLQGSHGHVLDLVAKISAPVSWNADAQFWVWRVSCWG